MTNGGASFILLIMEPSNRFFAALVSFALLAQAPAAFAADDGFSSLFSGGYDLKTYNYASPKELAVSSPTPTESAELAGFWERLRTGSIEPGCRKAEIKLKKNMTITAGVVGLGGNIKRAIRKFPDGKLALLDEIGLDLSLTLGRQVLSLPEVEGLGISVGLSSKLAGKSQVVRPIPSRTFCAELLEIARLYQLKTVLPATAKRVKKMAVGEIWKLPLSMTMGFSVGASANIQQVVNVSLSYGVSKQKKPSITLRRLEPNKLRLRLRLDRITVKSLGVSASTVEIPLDALGLEQAGALTADILGKATPKFARKWVTAEVFDKLLLKEINNYLAFKLSFSHSRFSGKKLLLEFILDPEDEDQLAKLQDFLRGELGIINRFREMGMSFRNFDEDDDALYGLEVLEDMGEEVGGQLGSNNTFAGTDIYHGRSSGFGANLPVVGNYRSDWGSSYHRYQTAGNGGETIHVHQRTRTYNGSTLKVPFLGAVAKHNSQRDVLVLNRENTDGSVTEPVLLYQQYEGLIGRGHGAAERVLEHANGMLRYVGVDGTGVDNSNQLPVSEIVAGAARYRAGVMSFKLLIDERGIKDIISAPAQAVMKAYMNVMRELYTELVDKVKDLLYIDKKGKVAYNKTAMMATLDLTDKDLSDAANPLNVVDQLVYGATALIRDLVSVREAPGWKERSQRLSDIAAGKGKNDLKYEDFFKVVLQLAKPSDVSAQVYVHLDPKKKGLSDVTQTYNYFESGGKGYDATLSDVTRMRERFAAPSDISD